MMAVALAGIAGATAPAAFAADGKITFNGLVEDVTCLVTGGAGTNGASGDFSITLPNVSKSALAAAGDRAGDKGFSVIIGGPGQTGCVDGKIAELAFDAGTSPIDPVTGRLLNQNGTAQVVQVGLLNGTRQDINLNDGSNNETAVIAGNTATLNYWAQYFAPGAGVTSGVVDTFVMYSVVYN
jgi:major type 1 subunit fimbrin (pilin)